MIFLVEQINSVPNNWHIALNLDYKYILLLFLPSLFLFLKMETVCIFDLSNKSNRRGRHLPTFDHSAPNTLGLWRKYSLCVISERHSASPIMAGYKTHNPVSTRMFPPETLNMAQN